MEQIAYNELKSRQKPTATIEESDDTYDCYELVKFNILYSIIIAKLPSAKYVHVEALWEPETNSQVFNLMFFDADEVHLGGCELTSQKLFWDDEDAAA